MVTSYIILWGALTVDLCILVLHFALKNTTFLLKNGLGIFVTCCLFCILRMVTPWELPFSQYELEYPEFISSLMLPHYFGKHEIPGFYFLIAISLIGSLVLLIYYIANVERHKFIISWNAKDDLDSLEILHSIDPSSKIRVRRSPAAPVPAVVGYRQPIIYLPLQEYSQEDLHNILRHEYTHIRYHHTTMRLILALLCILNWWNIPVWVFRADMSHLIELVCDELTTKEYDEKEKLNYLGTLIYCMNHKDSFHKRVQKQAAAYSLGFVNANDTLKNDNPLTTQRFLYLLNRDMISLPQGIVDRILPFLFYALIILWFLASYYFILQPAYEPETEPSLSGAYNSYLVEQEDGSYLFYFLDNIIDVPAEEVESDYYHIYPVIHYEDYKDVGNYEDCEAYQEIMEQMQEAGQFEGLEELDGLDEMDEMDEFEEFEDPESIE